MRPKAEAPLPEATAAFRFLHALPRPPVQLVFDGDPFTALPWNEESFRSSWLHPYLEYPAGEYELSAITTGEEEAEIMATSAVNLQAEHRYTLILYETDAGDRDLS